MDKPLKKGYLAALLYSFIIGFAFLFTKLAFTVASPLDILAYRFSTSFIFISISILLGIIKLNITKKDILIILPLALLNPAMFFAFQTFGLVYISSSEAGIIFATIPIFTMLFATFFLKERSTNIQKFFLFLSTIGVIYIFLMNGINFNLNNLKGSSLIVLSTISVSIYNVLARKMTKKYTPLDLTFMMTFLGFIIFNLMSITNHIINKNLNNFFKPLNSPMFIFSILYLGVFSSLITCFLSNYSLSKLEAYKMSVFNNLSTLLTIFAGVIFLKEKLEYFHIIGGILIIVGIIGTNFSDKIHLKKESK